MSNSKPDALSRQFPGDGVPGAAEDTILPPSCLVAPVTWDTEQRVMAALENQPGPSTYPPDWLFVPAELQSFCSNRFWCPALVRDTHQFVLACCTCCRSKPSNLAPAGLRHPLPVPHRPWSRVFLDLAGLVTCEQPFAVLHLSIPPPGLNVFCGWSMHITP